MNLWYPGAVRYDGTGPVGYADSYAQAMGYVGTGMRGPKRGDVKHSAEGTSWDWIHTVGIRTKSWHFTIGYDRVEQHWPWDINCHHASDTDPDNAVRANFELVGIEHLGVAGQPLTPYQIAETVKLSSWLAEQNQRDTFRRFSGFDPDTAGVWLECEHNEVSNTYTACPSNRIPWGVIMLDLYKPQEDELQILLHAADKVPGYAKSYLVFADKDGNVKKQHVKSAAENQALVAARFPVKVLADIGNIPDA